MKRIIIVVVVLTVLMAGCGGPGEAPDNETGGNETPQLGEEAETGPNEMGSDADERGAAVAQSATNANVIG